MKSTSALLVAVLCLSACQFKSVPKNDHQGEVKTEVQQKEEALPELKELAEIDLNTNYQLLKGLPAADSEAKNKAHQKVINDLRRVILNPKFIENPKYTGDERMKKALSYFNMSVLGQIETGQDQSALLKDYVAHVRRNCSADLEGCTNIGFFKSDWGSSMILVAYAKTLDATLDTVPENQRLESYREYYRVLKLALDLKNGEVNEQLDFLFIKRAKQFAVAFNSEKTNPNHLSATLREKSMINQMGRAFELMIEGIENKKHDPKVAQFVKVFQPWTYSVLNKDLFPYGTKKIFNIAAQTQLYTESGDLNPDFVAALKQSQGDDAKNPSFTQLNRDFLAKLSTTPQALSAPAVDTTTEYFFIVDRLFREHLEIDEISEVWKAVQIRRGAAVAAAALDQTVSNYLRWEILRRIASTNAYVQEIFQRGKYDPKTLVETVAQESREEDKKWHTLNDRAEILRTFLERQVLGTRNDNMSLASLRLILGIPRNTKYLASYPNMMLMAYMLEKTDAKVPIQTWFGEIQIPPGIVITAFLDGKIAPWFNFSRDNSPLNQVEILIAYDYALRTNVFNTLQMTDGKFKLSPLDFLRSMVKSYFSDEVKAIEEGQNFLVDVQSNSDLNTFRNLCRGVEKQVELSFDDLSRVLLVGNGDKSGDSPVGVAGAALKLFSSDGSSPLALLSSLNGTFQRKKVIVNSLGDILKNYYQEQNANDESVKKAVADVEKEVQIVQERLIQYYKNLKAMQTEATGCLDRLRATEKSMVLSMIDQERDYLEQVYTRLADLQGHPADAAKKELLAKFIKENSNGQDSLEGTTAYRYTRMGFFYRTLSRLQKTPFNVRVRSLPTPTEISRYNIGSLRMDINEHLSAQGKTTFVKMGLQKLNDSPGSFVSWIKYLNDTDKLEQRVRLLLAMYQTGIVLELPDKDRVQATDLIQENFRLLRSFHIDDKEAQLLSLMSLDYRISPLVFKNYFFRGMDPQAPLDFMFELLTKKDSEVTGLSEAQTFFQTVTGMTEVDKKSTPDKDSKGSKALIIDGSYFAFQPGKNLISNLDAAYTPLVRSYERLFHEILDAQQSCKKTSPLCSQPPQIRYDLRPDVQIYQGLTVGSRGSAPQLLNDSNTRFFSSRMESFHKKTNDHYRGPEAPTESNEP